MAALAAALEETWTADPTPFVRAEGKDMQRLDLAVKGARCANCIAKIEGGLKALDGVTDARLNLSSGKLAVRWRRDTQTPKAIVQCVAGLGYDARPYDPGAVLDNESAEGRILLRSLAVSALGSVLVVGLTDSIWYSWGADLGPATRQMLYWLAALVAIPSSLYAGRIFFRSAMKSIAARHANMDVPISLAIILSLALSLYESVLNGAHTYFDAAIMLVFFLLIGRYLDYVMRYRARSAARDLLLMQTATATRLDDEGHGVSIAASDIAKGDRLVLNAGDRAPVDGVIESETEADLSLVTGESLPIALTAGHVLHAGAIVTGKSTVLRATARVQDSLVAELARLLESGQQRRSAYVRLADRAAALYVPVVHGAAAAVFLFWLIVMHAPFALAAEYGIALLIITCPCALGLAVPAVQIVATSILFRRGLLVKSGDSLERLCDVDMAVFDKTGTLTMGRPQLLAPQGAEAALLPRAATLARASRHPLARALAAAAGQGPVATGAKEVAGYGVEAMLDGVTARLGRAEWVGVQNARADTSALWFRLGEEAPVRFGFSDRLRADSGKAIAALQARGIPVEMLSGDSAGPVADVAGEMRVAAWRAGVTPEAKAAYMRELAEKGRKVLMVGDGLNDAPALALAHVGISPGTALDATQAAADMVLQSERLMPLIYALDIARKAKRRVIENFGFAVLYNLVAIPVAAIGMATPLVASLAMASSSLVVTLNALRLMPPREI